MTNNIITITKLSFECLFTKCFNLKNDPERYVLLFLFPFKLGYFWQYLKNPLMNVNGQKSETSKYAIIIN